MHPKSKIDARMMSPGFSKLAAGLGIKGQVIGSLIYGQGDDDAKIPKSPTWASGKIADSVPI